MRLSSVIAAVALYGCVCVRVEAVGFTSQAADALKFGTHEIVLTGNGGAANPFETQATVKFTPPSGSANAVTVNAFYDGGQSWRARAYITETGVWHWTSRSTTDPGLNAKSGSFTARESSLRGMLRKHKANPRAWMTDDGRWFANISDTAYKLFHKTGAPDWQEYIREDAALGITSVRAASLGGWGGTPGVEKDDNNNWIANDPWQGGRTPDLNRYDLAKFQCTDQRLTWMMDHHPDIQVQLILFGLKGYRSEGTGKGWLALPKQVRERTMRYMLARWAAYPNVFWLIVNDMHADANFPANQLFAREVGTFFASHDPWKHLLSGGLNRFAGFPFTTADDLKWVSYLHIEEAYATSGDQIRKNGLQDIPLHVFMGEDRYEHAKVSFKDPRFFYRWLMWSWLLNGGSANYGGQYGVITPYSQISLPGRGWKDHMGLEYTGRKLYGLDSIPYVWPYFRDRKIDLAYFQPDDTLVQDLDGRVGELRAQATHRGKDEFLIYHPNASAAGPESAVDARKTVKMRVNLSSAPGRFEVEWFRPHDGISQTGTAIQGGAYRELSAPWMGHDVVLRLVRK